MMRYLCAATLLLAAGCATKYQPASGGAYGFSETAVADDVYRMRFVATADSTRETVQTYWLYRATEFTLEKGFDGFRILSPLALGQTSDSPFPLPELALAPPLPPSLAPSLAPSPYAEVTRSNALFIIIPGFSPRIIVPVIQADIELIKGPVDSNPPKVFDARQLRAALEPWVKAETKCESGNVCPHVKRYLRPAAETPQIKPAAVGSRLPELQV